MPIKLANNASTRLASPITAASTSITVESGGGDKFPVTDGDVYFPMTIVAADGQLEIVKCTARSSDTFTIERAQEGTTAKDFAAGSAVELRLTAGAMETVIQEAEDRLQEVADSLEGFGIGDYLTTKRNPGANWLRRDGGIYNKSDYPALGAYFETLPAGIIWGAHGISNVLVTSSSLNRVYGFSNGSLALTYENSIQVSTDLAAFGNKVNLSFSNPGAPVTITTYAAFGDGKIVAIVNAGQTAGTSTAAGHISTDNGQTFSAVTISGMSACGGITYFNGYFIAIDQTKYQIFYSSNGTSWTAGPKISSLEGNPSLWGIEYFFLDDGTYLWAFPSQNYFAGRTSNGTSWTGDIDPLTQGLLSKSMVYDGGFYLGGVSATPGKIAKTSSIGAAWAEVTTGTSGSVSGIAKNGGFIVMTTMSGDAALSSNSGVTWSTNSTGAPTAFYRVISHPTLPRKFFAVGDNGLVLGDIPETDMFAVPNDDPTMGWIKAK